jgi:GR25 family glycosyltransferase involved in LPS biosynthesis
MKFYCLHHPPLIDRKEFLEERFKTLNLDVEWVTGFSPETLSFPETSSFKNIGEYSLYLKHQYCFEQQVINNYDFVTILEDDALLEDNFNEHFNTCLNEFKDINGDLMFLGICCDIKPSYTVPGKHVYWEPGFLTRCTHCYTTTLSAAKILLKDFQSKQMAADYKINDVIRNNNLKSCYAEPGIHQGSHGGKFDGSLRN